jgi:hypothetical protein
MVEPYKDVTLSYVEAIQFTTASGAITNYSFALNNVYDPNSTGTGHQPLGYDEWANFYARYIVVGFHCDIIATNEQTSYPVDVVYTLQQYSTSYTDIPNALEQVGAENVTLGLPSSGNATRRFTKSVYLPDYFGLPLRSYLGQSDYQAFVGSSPTNVGYFHITSQPHGSVTADTHLLIKLKYQVRFLERRATIADS